MYILTASNLFSFYLQLYNYICSCIAILIFLKQVPDTVEESLMARIMTRPDDSCCCGGWCNRAALRRSLMWALYVFIGASVSLLITAVLIENSDSPFLT